MAVPSALMAVATAFWFFTVQHQSVSVPVQIAAWTNCGVDAVQVPPAIFDPTGQEAVHDEEAPPPGAVGPVHET
jgi:hypothetical protein